ncbi:unnamed protein product [Effrenium voratum]|nr:unnamed protein product [Effrenium voratum]CAJ1455064.1 unnamed protein product [Effrenium voratum]
MRCWCLVLCLCSARLFLAPGTGARTAGTARAALRARQPKWQRAASDIAQSGPSGQRQWQLFCMGEWDGESQEPDLEPASYSPAALKRFAERYQGGYRLLLPAPLCWRLRSWSPRAA